MKMNLHTLSRITSLSSLLRYSLSYAKQLCETCYINDRLIACILIMDLIIDMFTSESQAISTFSQSLILGTVIVLCYLSELLKIEENFILFSFQLIYIGEKKYFVYSNSVFSPPYLYI